MGGGAAQLLHSPIVANDLSEVMKIGAVHRRRSARHPVSASKQSCNQLLVNSSLNSRGALQRVHNCPAIVYSTRQCLKTSLREYGGRKNGRISCSESDFVESSPNPYNDFRVESSADTAFDTSTITSPGSGREGFYTDSGIEVIRNFEDTELEIQTRRNAKQDSSLPSAQESRAGENTLSSANGVGTKDSTPSSLPAPNVELDQEILDSMQNREAAAALLGSENGNKSLFDQMKEILVFAGPALGIWLSGPLMSIIDTAVVGQSSSLELAALGPGTVLCDQLTYVFMFLSIATSNMIATALAQKDEGEAAAAGHLSRLLFISLFCGVVMLLITELFSTPLLQAFVGVKNYSIIPAARTYVQIRALAWPIVLVGMVSQSASLGMRDSWGPLKVLAIASAVNLVGDIVLCSFLGCGIAGAAWATMASQYIAGILMLKALGDKGYNPLAINIPSWNDFVHIIKLAAPILLTMLSKVSFYTLITYLATSLGAVTLAAHQVMIGIFSLCTVWGEPLAQTAQSFMPALIYGSNRNLKQARELLRTLIVIGAITGLFLGSIAVSVPWLFPQLFTRDPAIISQMRAVTVPFFLSLAMTPPTLSCEGTLLAGRDLKFLGYSMASCFLGGSFLLLLSNRLGIGLSGSWWTLVAFQTTRFIQSYTRLAGSKSVLADEPTASGLHLKAA